MISWFESMVLGCVQGIAEWLPVSSEGMLVLVQTNLFGRTEGLMHQVEFALFLHLGTFLAALIYLRKEVQVLVLGLFRAQEANLPTRKVLRFLFVSTLISGVLGLGLLKMIDGMEGSFEVTGRGLTGLVGILLLITGGLQMTVRRNGAKGSGDLGWGDAVLLGVAQGLAALPGLSRSGLTVSAFLLRGYDKSEALRLSFLMSLPIVLGGNILLHFATPQFTLVSLAAVGMACLSGIATIHLLFQLAKKINFGIFVLGFGLLTLSAVLL